MLNAKELARIITAELNQHPSQATPDTIEAAAVKIAGILEEDNKLLVSAAALENEVTSTLMDMLAATILATLIDQEGGGRTNITFSPHSMKEKMAAWNYTVETDGLIRTVRISPVNEAEFEPGDGDQIQRGMMLKGLGPVVDSGKVLPQAEPKEYNRPVWAIRVDSDDPDDQGSRLLRMHDQADATRQLRQMVGDHPTAKIENRFCLHPDCPATGCNRESAPEVASEA